MAIFLRQSHNVKPPRWGSFADVQYAIRVNSEKIYDVDSDSLVLAMPLFWGLPCLDYSGYNNHGTNYGATYKDGSLDFGGTNEYIIAGAGAGLTGIKRNNWTMSCTAKWRSGTLEPVIGLGDSASAPDGVILINRNGTIQAYQTNVYRDSGVTTPMGFVHLTLTRESSTVGNLYINGIKYSTNPTSTSSDIMDSRIGRLGGTAIYADIVVSESHVNNITLSASQIALFHDLPYGLYQPVSRVIYSIPAGEGWTGKIYGVTNPAKIMGVIVANINKVTGVVSGA